MRSVQHCSRCGRDTPDDSTAMSCPACGSLLEIRHTAPSTRGIELASTFAKPPAECGPSGVWRFRALVHPAAARLVTWPEGHTPLIARDRLARYTSCAGLLIKHEGMNPTGSFKDRGMTVALTQALRLNATAVGCASTGNTSASLAAYAALAGLPALVFVPAGQVSAGKLAQTQAYGATTLLVRGDFDRCLWLMRQASDELGVYLANSVNPWRIEGQKTIVFELLEQLGWNAPEWIALPAGNLGNTAAFGKALREAYDYGLISRLPRLLAVQASGAAPFAGAFRANFSALQRVNAETRATAIRIGDPASYERAVAAIRLTNGVVCDVTDEAIFDAKAEIDRAGVGCEPASAASVAGVRLLRNQGLIGASDRVVAVLTGHLLKDTASVTWHHQERVPPPEGVNRPIEIDPTLSEIEKLLRGTKR